jgi:hypothetical protein
MKKLLLTISLFLLIHGAWCTPKGVHSFKESIKDYGDINDAVMIRSNLYLLQKDNSTILLDGSMTQYRDDFSDNIDSLDIRKMSNFSENFGLIRGNTTLVVERRKTISDADTIFFKLWNTHQRDYQFQFTTQNFNRENLTGYLEDQYLHTLTPLVLNDTNHINFSINSDPASANALRFRIVFRSNPVPEFLKLTSINAFQENNFINVGWKNEFNKNISEYIIERSGDGHHFTNIATVSADYLSINYMWTDYHPLPENNYYRLQTIELNGKTNYTDVVKAGIRAGGIEVYPNPATSNNLNLKMINQAAGVYKVRILNSFGQAFLNTTFNYGGGSVGVQKLNPGKEISTGMYFLEILKPNGEKQTVKLLLQQ